jgi:hypothetical protein
LPLAPDGRPPGRQLLGASREPDALPFAIITQRFLRQFIQFSGFGVGFNLSVQWLFPRLHRFFQTLYRTVHDNVFELLHCNYGHSGVGCKFTTFLDPIMPNSAQEVMPNNSQIDSDRQS